MAHNRSSGLGSKPVRNGDREMECTPECYSTGHARVVLTVAFLGNLRLLQHCSNLCSNSWRICDRLGRNPLHVATSRGHTHLAEWLITKKRVAVDTADWESGWSALHRSVYFGELGTAVSLVKLGASLSMRDHDGLTPLSLLNKDRLSMPRAAEPCTTDVYTWGSNTNTTLGHAHSRPYPERLELVPPHLSITQVVVEKFHSVLLTSSGLVMTCGHGRGGRLGHDSEASFVAPRLVEALKRERCVSVAAARNHTVFLTDSGMVYTCGLNDAHQLGLGSAPNSAPKQCLTPTPITAKVLKGRQIKYIGVGRYHTALATDTQVYTFGQNLGQLGYEKHYHTQILPKPVPQISLEGDDCILTLSASHAATAVLTKKHKIIVCYDYTVKTIRCGFLEKLECRQFNVCAPLTDRAHLRGTSPEPTKILLLDSELKLWYWEPGKKGSVPNLLPGLAKYNVAHFTLGKHLTIVTDEGEAYTSLAQSGVSLSFTRVPAVQNASAIFTDFKAINFAYLQTTFGVLDLPKVSPPTLTSDLCGLLKEDNILDSVSDINIQSGGVVVPAHRFVISHFSSHSLSSSSSSSSSSTVILPPSPPHLLPALLHYLYGSTISLVPIPEKSDSGTTLTPPTVTGNQVDVTPDTSFASVDENDLTEVYDRFGSQSPPPLHPHHRLPLHPTASSRGGRPYHNGFDEIELVSPDRLYSHSTPKKKKKEEEEEERKRELNSLSVKGGGEGEVVEVMCINLRSDLQSLLKLATELQISSLTKRLDDIQSNFTHKQAYRTIVLTPPPLSLSPSSFTSLSSLYDVTLTTSDSISLHCHKCILVARSDYFRSMLLMGWRETSEGSTTLSLPFSSDLLSTVLDFIYTDTAPSVTDSDSLEWIVQVLVTADQLLLTRLRDICELTLAKRLTQQRVCEIMEVAATCSTTQLMSACLQFISANAAALLEARLLDCLSGSLLSELSVIYKHMIPQAEKRLITFPDPDPSELPESYFLEGGGGGEEEIYDLQDFIDRETDTRSPVSEFSGGSQSNNSRRRRREARRRKSSQSEAATRKSRDSGGGHGSSNSPSPTPTSPLTLPDSTTPTTSPDDLPSPPSSSTVATETPTHPTQTCFKPVSDPSSKPVPDTSSSAVTPKSLSAGRSGRGGRSQRQKKSRKRLTESYRADGGEEERGGGEGGRGGQEKEKDRGGELVSPLTNGPQPPPSPPSPSLPPAPPHLLTKTKKVWGGKDKKPVCLKDIMAEEEEKEMASQSLSPPTPPPPPSLPSPPLHQVTSPRSLPPSRQTSSEAPLTLSSSLPRSPPAANPWRTTSSSTTYSSSSSCSAPSVISLKQLMEEEAKMAERTKTATRSHPPLATSSSSPHPPPSTQNHSLRRRRPSVPQTTPTPTVSFADIIQSQQREHDTQHMSKLKKQLSSIQIEQKAINQLEALYGSRDNPDEYITVKRCRPHPGHTSSLRIHYQRPKNHTHAPPTTGPWNGR